MVLDDLAGYPRWRLAIPATVAWLCTVVIALRAGMPAKWQDLADLSGSGQAGAITVVCGLIAVGAAANLATGLLAMGVRGLWLGYLVPGPLATRLLRRRRRRWDRAHELSSTAPTLAARVSAERLRTRIALAEPESPTWMGDRLAALHTRVRAEYGLDLPSAWNRLWLIAPESGRTAVHEARTKFVNASCWMAWSTILAATGVIWWPALVTAIVPAAVALYEGRSAVAAVTDLAEAMVDITSLALANELGITVEGHCLGLGEAQQINRRIRKGA